MLLRAAWETCGVPARLGSSLATGAGLLAVAVLAQVTLGVLTLLRSAPIGLAMIHQAMALFVLTAATLHASRALSPRSADAFAICIR